MSAAEGRHRWVAVVSGLVILFSVILPLTCDYSAAELIYTHVGDLTGSFRLVAAMRLLLFATPYMLAAIIAARELMIVWLRKQSFELNVVLAFAMTAAIAGGALLAVLFGSDLGLVVMAWTGLFMAGLPSTLIVLAHRNDGFRSVFELVEVAGAGIIVWWAGIVIWEINDGDVDHDLILHPGALVLGLAALTLFGSLMFREVIIFRRAGLRR